MNVVLTSLLTKEVDPMRGRKWEADPSILETWAASIKGALPIVVADELSSSPQGVGLVNPSGLEEDRSYPSGGPYFNRWVYFLQWLTTNQHTVDWVWLTDGSDVIMLREPWGQMEEDTLYVGSEEMLVGCDWMQNVNHHPTPIEQQFVDSHRDHKLLNAGLVGGHVTTVMAFLTSLLEQWVDAGYPAKSDMAIFNLTAYCDAPGPVVTGEQVHTIFWANKDNGTAWWQHK